MNTIADLSERMMLSKINKGLTWQELANKIGRSDVFIAAAFSGQMRFSDNELQIITQTIGLNLTDEDMLLLKKVVYREDFPGFIPAVPTDPTIYTLYEILIIYGRAVKAIIEEEFGDGTMSTRDMTVKLEQVEDPKGDRVRITLNGVFLPFMSF